MKNNDELSANDKKLLETYDISIFKSAIAYFQNSKTNSNNKVPQNSPFKAKVLYEKEPPLLPVESRIAFLTKKYATDRHTLQNNIKNDEKIRYSEDMVPSPEPQKKQSKKPVSIGHNGVRFLSINRSSRQSRRASHYFSAENTEDPEDKPSSTPKTKEKNSLVVEIPNILRIYSENFEEASDSLQD